MDEPTHPWTGLPRAYPLTPLFQGIVTALAFVLFAGGALGARAAWAASTLSPGWRAGLCGVALIVSVLGLVLAADAFVSRLVVTREAITAESLFMARTLPLSELAGRSARSLDGMETLYLLPRRPPWRPIAFAPSSLVLDEEFTRWFEGLTDLPAAAARARAAAVLADPSLGADATARVARLVRAGRRAQWARRAAFVVGVWTLVLPRPYALCVALCAAMPFVALALYRHGAGAYQLDGHRDDPRAELLTPIAGPAAVLALRGLYDVELMFDLRALVVIAVAWGLFGAAGGAATRRSSEPREARWVLVFAGAFWAMGLVPLLNGMLDQGPVRRHEARVVRKYITSDKSHTRMLVLAPWGGQAEGTHARTTDTVYESVVVGGTVCVSLHPGALGIVWLTLEGGRCARVR